MRFLKHTCLIVLSCASVCLYGQTEDTLDEVIIVPIIPKQAAASIQLPKKLIETQLPADLGQLTLFFPGIQLKSYGDIGGMKTVQFRSLGAGHSAIVQDYQQLSTSQSGQADLSQVPAEFIHSLALISLNPSNLNIPIGAKLAGNVLFLESQLLAFRDDSTSGKLSFQLGSFNLLQGTAYGKLKHKRNHLAGFAKIRSYEGAYPFTYTNGNTLESSKRLNNGLFEYYGTLIGERQLNEKHKIRLIIQANQYHKELAGAVIFYNPSINQYLNGYGFSSALQHEYETQKFTSFSRFNYQYQALQYLDSAYLNNQGYLDNRYYSQQIDGDIQVKKNLGKAWVTVVGIGITSEVVQSKNLDGSPNRSIVPSILGLERKGKFNLALQFGHQLVLSNRTTNNVNSYFTPSLAAGLFLKKIHFLQIIAKHTVRQPSFTEMYYQQIGNTNLKAEEANLASIRYQLTLKKKRWQNSLTIEPFYTYVTNKILAIPTKNLFIWSIQNIGKTQAFGTEATLHSGFGWKKQLIAFRTNYTFQYAIDISTPSNATYKHILSYSPLHNGTAQLSYERGNWYTFVSLNALSSRYTVNQNSNAYLLEGFYTLDMGVQWKLNFKKSNLGINAQLKNITNNSYSYIAYYILPGINGTIRLTYAF